MINSFTLRPLSCVVAVLLGGQVLAATAAPALETVVVSASHAPLPEAATTATLSVLDRELLQRQGSHRLAEVLRAVPGLLIEEQGGDGGLTALSLRGGEANFTQVLLDGVPLNDPSNARGGSYDVSLLNGMPLERIEVVRGPQSVIHGSDALAGVVHLVSRAPGAGKPPRLRLAGGESGFRDYRLDAGLDIGALGVSVELGRRESGEQVAGSERDTDLAALRARWQLSETQVLSGQLRRVDSERSSYPEQSGGPLFATRDALEQGDYRNTLAALTWDAELLPSWGSRLQLSHLEQQEDVRSPGIAPYAAVPPNGSDSDFRRSEASWVNTLRLGDRQQLNLGADLRDERGDSRGYLDLGVRIPTDYRLSRQTLGTFAEWRGQVAEPLLLQASVRSDDPEGFASRTTARAGLRYAWRPAVVFRFNWGEGFKLPSFFALGHALVGNPELKPETARGWDAGVEWRPDETLSLAASVFSNRYRNLIDFDPAAFTNVNRREVETEGVEGQLDWRPHARVRVRGHLTYTDIDVIGEDRTLLGRPAWKAGAWLDWEFQPRWRLGLDYQWTGEIPAASLHTGDTRVTDLGAYHRLDTQLAWQSTPELLLSVALDNLLDENYQTSVGFPGQGRTLRFAVTLQLAP